MSAQGKNTLKSLVRKLLVKVHPDVVASKSAKAREHNEKALQQLLSCIEGDQPQLRAQGIFFYLRDGGRTSTVQLDSQNPERSVQTLLGIVNTEPDVPSTEELIDESPREKIPQEELSRMFKDAMSSWWLSRDHLMNEIDLLFKQNRVRYAPNAFDLKEPIDYEMDEIDIKKAVELAKETLEFYVEDSTLEALQHPELQRVDFVVVARNLEDVHVENDTLYVSIETQPDVFGREIDDLVDSIVAQAVMKQS